MLNMHYCISFSKQSDEVSYYYCFFFCKGGKTEAQRDEVTFQDFQCDLNRLVQIKSLPFLYVMYYIASLTAFCLLFDNFFPFNKNFAWRYVCNENLTVEYMIKTNIWFVWFDIYVWYVYFTNAIILPM